MDQDSSLSNEHFSRKVNRTTYSPVFSLIVLAVCVVVLVSYLLHILRWVNHANYVIEKTQSAEKLMLNLQAATRGYYLTGDPRLLKGYRQGQSQLPAALGTVRELVNDDASQAKLADNIIAKTHDWMTWASVTEATTEPSRGHRASTMAVLIGQNRFDPVRDDLATFLHNEYALRDHRTRKATRAAWLSLLIGAIVTFIVALAQCAGVRRQVRIISENYRNVLRMARDRRQRIEELVRELDGELEAVGEIQRSLLPIELPTIPSLDIAASYQTSRRAGGDYYDFFKLPPMHAGAQSRFGILIADVSGHGTPAAVLMAVTHSIAHSFENPQKPPAELLAFVNRRLCEAYTTNHNAFVTAFYAVYDPATRELTYSSAGHNPPRLRAGGNTFTPLDDAQGMPLGVMMDAEYISAPRTLQPGDTLVLYTDGITEARNPAGEFLNVEGLDAAINAANPHESQDMLRGALNAVNQLTGEVVSDDRTLLILRICAPTERRDSDEPRHAVVSETAPSADSNARAVSAPPEV